MATGQVLARLPRRAVAETASADRDLRRLSGTGPELPHALAHAAPAVTEVSR